MLEEASTATNNVAEVSTEKKKRARKSKKNDVPKVKEESSKVTKPKNTKQSQL